jgi:hypothetical protein
MSKLSKRRKRRILIESKPNLRLSLTHQQQMLTPIQHQVFQKNNQRNQIPPHSRLTSLRLRLKRKKEKIRRKQLLLQRLPFQRTQLLKLPKLLSKMPLMRRLELQLKPLRPKPLKPPLLLPKQLNAERPLKQEIKQLAEVVNSGPLICQNTSLVDTFKLKYRILDANSPRLNQENTIAIPILTLTLILIAILRRRS